jgi:hypothetical protein
MQNPVSQAFMDTVPWRDSAHPPAADKEGTTPADFDEDSRPGDLWPEAADAQCSEHAALFADSQPSPLSIV